MFNRGMYDSDEIIKNLPDYLKKVNLKNIEHLVKWEITISVILDRNWFNKLTQKKFSELNRVKEYIYLKLPSKVK